MRIKSFFIIAFLISLGVNAQHSFSGYVDNNIWQNDVYLSIIDDYRKISGVYSEQIIAKIQADSTGYFEFRGNLLETENKIYRIHVDNCTDADQNKNHFGGHCPESKEIIFIAKHNDTIVFPFSFDEEMFCSIQSNNPKATTFIKIDSLKEEMRFAFGEFRSEANRKLNTKKWFKTLQDYGKQLNEPIAELYIYAFLSNRSNSNNLHEYYLEDLKKNAYYDNLLTRLTEKYPNANYTKQYKTELLSDKYSIASTNEKSEMLWFYIIMALLVLSLLGNLYFWVSNKNRKSKKIAGAKEQLTKQEQNILTLLLEEKTNKEIAETLFVSLSTVKTHVNNIYKKLNVQSRSEIKSLFSK